MTRGPNQRWPWILALRTCSLGSFGAFTALALAASLPAASHAAEPGRAQVVDARGGGWEAEPIAEGTLDAAFSLSLPDGAACTGDSTTGGYRVQSFMVPDSVDPASLTYGATGPRPSGLGEDFRQPLFMPSSKSFVNAATNMAAEPGGAGTIINVPDFALDVFADGQLPSGGYLVGIACTKGPPSDAQLDRYWVTDLEVGAAEAGAAGPPGAWRATGSLSVAETAPTPSVPTAADGPGSALAAPEADEPPVAGTRPIAADLVTTPSASGDEPSVAGDGESVIPPEQQAAPTGGLPTFHVPVLKIASTLSVTGSVEDSLLLWLATAVLSARAAFLLARQPPPRPPTAPLTRRHARTGAIPLKLTNPRARRVARHVAAIGAATSAVVMTLSLSALVSPTLADAAVLLANATIVTPKGGTGAGAPLASGDSNTSFSLALPAGAACAADGLNGGRWHAYMVPGSEDPASIAFNGNGSLRDQSTATGGTGTFRHNVYSIAGLPVRGQAPNQGDAAVINIPNVNFAVWEAGQIAAGTYNIGIACVDLDATPSSSIDHIWNARIEVASATASTANPAGITWTTLAAASPSPSPSPSRSASPSPSPSRSASPSPSPSRSASPSPSVSPSPSASPSPTPSRSGSPAQLPPDDPTAPSTSVLSSVGFPDSGGSSVGSGGSLPRTGGSPFRLLGSGLLLLVFGRMVVLLGRPVSIVGVRP